MFTIIGLMLTGMLLGYLLRKRNLHKIHTVITVLIWALLFILGIEVGGNEQIIKGLHTIGIEAVILTLAVLWEVSSLPGHCGKRYIRRKEEQYERQSYYNRFLRFGYALRSFPPDTR